MMKQFATAMVILTCGGCFSSGPDVRPARDHWAVAEGGSPRKTISSWGGVLEWREVFDERGGRHHVAVITRVSGLNPRDAVNPSGKVTARRAMPEVFYLCDGNRRLYTAVDVPAGEVRVTGQLTTTWNGGTVPTANSSSQAYLVDITTRPATDTYRYSATIRPLIWVEKIEAIPLGQ